MGVIVDIVFGVWLFLIVLIIAFVRGASLPPARQGFQTREHEDAMPAGLSLWHREAGD